MTQTPVAPLSDWRMTPHAWDRVADRAVTAQELWSLLSRPQRVTPDMKGAGASTYAGYGITAIVDPVERVVLTVGIDGASSTDWEVHALRPRDRADLLPLRVDAEPADDEGPRQAAPKQRSRSSAVQSRNVLDDLHPAIRDEVLRQADGDVRRITVHSRTRATVAPPR